MIVLYVSDSNDVTAMNFMEALDDGLVVCRLAKTIQEQAQQAVEEGRAKGVSSLFIQFDPKCFISVLFDNFVIFFCEKLRLIFLVDKTI